jgi:hypothetical protein
LDIRVWRENEQNWQWLVVARRLIVSYSSVMTKHASSSEERESEPGHCRWCRRRLPDRLPTGRPRKFCSQRCRQWDWVSRQRSAELKLSDDELVIARTELDVLHDQLYVLACAVEDTERDLSASGRRTIRDLRDSLEWLLSAARPLRDGEIGASQPD